MQFKKGRAVSIRSRKEIEKIIQESKKYRTNNFLLSVRRNNSEEMRYAIVIPKKKIKKAVPRSRLRRLLREALFTHRLKLKGNDILCLVIRPLDVKGLDFQDVSRELNLVLDKIENSN